MRILLAAHAVPMPAKPQWQDRKEVDVKDIERALLLGNRVVSAGQTVVIPVGDGPPAILISSRRDEHQADRSLK